MTPVDIEGMLTRMLETMAPGTMIIVKLTDDGSESSEEILEEPDQSDVYDDFRIDTSGGSFGGGAQDAILMDNPLQS